MKKLAMATTLIVLSAIPVTTAFGQNSQERALILLQGDVVALGNQVSQLQKSLDERNAVFQRLIEQVLDMVVGLSDELDRVTGTSDDVRMSNETLSGEMRVQISSLRNDLEVLDRNIRDIGARLDAISNQITTMNTTSTQLSDPTDEFDQAYADLTAGATELARRGFRDFIQSYPTSPRAGEAQLYVATSYYNDADYNSAIIEFDVLLQNYPNSDKRSEALYKKGLAHQNLGQRQPALATFRRVMSEYPESREAALAELKVQDLELPE